MCTNPYVVFTAPQQKMADIEEAEASPLETENKTSDNIQKQSSENSMLLDDTLQNLSSENSPPDEVDVGPKPGPNSQTFFHSKSTPQSAGYSELKKKFEKFGPTTRGAHLTSKEIKEAQPQADDLSEAKHTFVKLKPTSGKVGAIASSFSKPSEPAASKRPPFAILKPTPTTSGGKPSTSVAAKKAPTTSDSNLSVPAEQPAPAETKRPPFPNLKPISGEKPHTSVTQNKAPTPSKMSEPPAPAEVKRTPFANLKPTSMASGGAPSTSAAEKKAPSETPKSDAPPVSSDVKNAFVKLRSTASSTSTGSSQKSAEGQSSTSLDSNEEKNKFVQLRKVHKDNDAAMSKDTELSKLHLKKSTRSTPPVSVGDCMHNIMCIVGN